MWALILIITSGNYPITSTSVDNFESRAACLQAGTLAQQVTANSSGVRSVYVVCAPKKIAEETKKTTEKKSALSPIKVYDESQISADLRAFYNSSK